MNWGPAGSQAGGQVALKHRPGRRASGAGGFGVNPDLGRTGRGPQWDPGVWVAPGSGSPVSCTKSTSVIPQVSTVCPVRTRTPGLSSAQGAIATAGGPTRKKRPEGLALRGTGAEGARGLADPAGGGADRATEASYWVVAAAVWPLKPTGAWGGRGRGRRARSRVRPKGSLHQPGNLGRPG